MNKVRGFTGVMRLTLSFMLAAIVVFGMAPAKDAKAQTSGANETVQSKDPNLTTPIAPPPRTETICTDGKDNDRDGRIDCKDPDCSKNTACSCICPTIYAPVCGVNGVTYENSCKANCAKVAIKHTGACGTTTVPKTCGGIASLQCPDNFVCNMQPQSCDIADMGGVCVPKPEVCPQIIAPVCGCNGVTYDNDCLRLQAGAALAHKGACSATCTCTTEYAPVCGTDGATYSNECLAKCAGVAVSHAGACSQKCGGIAGTACAEGYVCNYIDPTCSIADNGGICVRKPDVCLNVYAPVCGCDGVTYSNDCYRIQAGATLASRGKCSTVIVK